MEIKPKMIAYAVLGLFLLIILLQNTEVVSFRLLFWELTMSRIILFPLVMCLGMIVGFILGKKL